MQRRGEPAAVQHQVGPVPERPHGGRDRRGQAEPVVRRGRGEQRRGQVLLTGGPAVRGQRGAQRRAHGRTGRRPAERGAEPLAVRRVAAVHQQAQPHQVTGQPGGDDHRAEVVTGLGAPAGKRFFLADPLPLAGQQIAPDVPGVPGQAGPGRGQLTQAVMEHRAAGQLGQPLGRRGQPVQRGDPGPRVEAELAAQPRVQRGDPDVVPGRGRRLAAEREADRVAAEAGRQLAVQCRRDQVRFGAGRARGQQELQPRAPVVVGGPFAVEAEHLGARAEQRGRVAQPGVELVQQRPDHVRVELPGQLQAGQERRPHPADPACPGAQGQLVFPAA